MPRVSDIVLFSRNEQPVISIRTRAKVEDLPAIIGASYAKLAAYLDDLNSHLADMPFVGYFNMDMQNLDVEIGFPVAKPLAAKEDIKPSFLPGGLLAACMYRGEYSEMAPVYGEMLEWIKNSGFEPAGAAYECYYNGPGFAPSEFLTKIIMPVK